MSTRRHLSGKTVAPVTQDADGKPLCRACSKPVPKGRRSTCSRECADTITLWFRPNYQRQLVFKRDKGVCALCGCDTVRLRHILKCTQYGVARWARILLRFNAYNSLWEMDHITPVVEGGGVAVGMTKEAILANLRTLCTPCHKDETKILAGRRAAQRKGQLTFDSQTQNQPQEIAS